MSVFRQAEQRRVVISFYLLECYGEIAEEAEQDEGIGERLLRVWPEVFDGEPGHDDLSYVCERFAQIDKELEEHDDKQVDETGNKPQTLGSEFMDWISGLKPDELCLWLARYDWNLARQLYVECDFEDVRALSKLKSAEDFHQVQASFEAAMYGFGGSYKSDSAGSSGDENVIDVGTEEGLAEMDAALGLG